MPDDLAMSSLIVDTVGVQRRLAAMFEAQSGVIASVMSELERAVAVLDAVAQSDDGPRVWALPDEPGPEVTAVRDSNGRRWTRRPDLGRWECERKLAGMQVIESWQRLYRAAAPLTDATGETQ